MKIVIVGAGFTGVQLAKLLINEKNEVALIDNNEETIRHAQNLLDCTVVCADGNNLETLEDVGIAKANALVCVTSSDDACRQILPSAFFQPWQYLHSRHSYVHVQSLVHQGTLHLQASR